VSVPPETWAVIAGCNVGEQPENRAAARIASARILFIGQHYHVLMRELQYFR